MIKKISRLIHSFAVVWATKKQLAKFISKNQRPIDANLQPFPFFAGSKCTNPALKKTREGLLFLSIKPEEKLKALNYFFSQDKKHLRVYAREQTYSLLYPIYYFSTIASGSLSSRSCCEQLLFWYAFLEVLKEKKKTTQSNIFLLCSLYLLSQFFSQPKESEKILHSLQSELHKYKKDKCYSIEDDFGLLEVFYFFIPIAEQFSKPENWRNFLKELSFLAEETLTLLDQKGAFPVSCVHKTLYPETEDKNFLITFYQTQFRDLQLSFSPHLFDTKSAESSKDITVRSGENSLLYCKTHSCEMHSADDKFLGLLLVESGERILNSFYELAPPPLLVTHPSLYGPQKNALSLVKKVSKVEKSALIVNQQFHHLKVELQGLVRMEEFHFQRNIESRASEIVYVFDQIRGASRLLTLQLAYSFDPSFSLIKQGENQFLVEKNGRVCYRAILNYSSKVRIDISGPSIIVSYQFLSQPELNLSLSLHHA